jgi:hypothetical protein
MSKLELIETQKIEKLTKNQLTKINGGSGGSGAIILVPTILL